MASVSQSTDAYAVPHGRPVRGRMTVPGSKSLTQRYLNLALLGGLSLDVHRPLLSEDTRLYLDALAVCGFRVEHGTDRVSLTPGRATICPPPGEPTICPPPGERPSGGEIFCGAGGTMYRFLTAALTVLPGTWR